MRESGFYSRQGHKISFFSTVPEVALEPTHISMEWVPEAVCLEIKRPGVKVTSHLRLMQRFRILGAVFSHFHSDTLLMACLIGDMGNSAFTFYLLYVMRTLIPNLIEICSVASAMKRAYI
jgi:hypothetical protein